MIEKDMPQASNAILELSDLKLDIGDTQIVDKLNLSIQAGEFWAILGANGSGKTTLLKSLCKLHSPSQGKILLKQSNLALLDPKDLAQQIGLMQQEYEYLFPCTVEQAVLLGRHPYKSSWQWESKDDREISQCVLEQTGLKHLSQRQVKTLSGGEKRRLHLAMLLSQNPDIFLLDEPDNHLDLGSQYNLLDLLSKHFKRAQKTGIMVTHDPNLAYHYCDHALLLFGDGQTQVGKIEDILIAPSLSLLYGYPIEEININASKRFLPKAQNSF